MFATKNEGLPLGYIIHTDKKIVKIALIKDVPGEELLALLFVLHIFNSFSDTLEMKILPQYVILRSLVDFNITF